MASSRNPNTSENALQAIDLFAGGGGFGLGLSWAGFNVPVAVEIDAWACDTLRLNHPETIVVQKDITQISEEEIHALCPKKPHLIVGGPPCQGFSIAGPAKKDPSDPRNSLFIYFAKWVECLKPPVFVMENVKGLLSRRNSEGKNVANIIEDTFRKLGYKVQIWNLNAANFGVPQLRERIFFVGTLLPGNLEAPLPTHSLNNPPASELEFGFLSNSKARTLWDAISDLPPLRASEGEEVQPYDKPPQNEYQEWIRDASKDLFNHVAMCHSSRVVERFKHIKWGESSADVPEGFGARRRNGQGALSEASYDQNNRRLHPHKPSHTIAASFYANFVHPYQHRNLTAREGARLQSFPDSYRFLGKKTVVSQRLLQREERLDEKFLCQYNQIGNAVPPLLAESVAIQVKNHLQHARHNVKVSSRLQPLAKRAA